MNPVALVSGWLYLNTIWLHLIPRIKIAYVNKQATKTSVRRTNSNIDMWTPVKNIFISVLRTSDIVDPNRAMIIINIETIARGMITIRRRSISSIYQHKLSMLNKSYYYLAGI